MKKRKKAKSIKELEAENEYLRRENLVLKIAVAVKKCWKTSSSSQNRKATQGISVKGAVKASRDKPFHILLSPQAAAEQR